MPTKTKRVTSRVSRSISFEGPVYQYLLKRSKEERRSPNWMVNEFVRRDLEAASTPAGVPQRK